MSDQEGEDDQVKQRMDAMLLKLLKTPPKSRAEVSEAVRRAKGKASVGRTSQQGRRRRHATNAKDAQSR